MVATERTRTDEKLAAIAIAIAMEMGEEWQVEASPAGSPRRDFKVLGPNEQGFSIAGPGEYETRRAMLDRVTIDSLYPHTPGWDFRPYRMGAGSGHEPSPEISCSIDRGPVEIVREFKRRLLPAYLAYHAKVMERKQVHEEYEANKAGIMAQLVASGLFQAALHAPDRLWMNGRGRGMVQVSSDVRFEAFSTTPERAIRIAAILAEEATA